MAYLNAVEFVVSYFLFVGKSNRLSDPLHPSLLRAYDELESFFLETICADEDKGGQAVLTKKDRYTKVLNMVPDVNGVRERIMDEWNSNRSSGKDRWKQLKSTVLLEKKNLRVRGE